MFSQQVARLDQVDVGKKFAKPVGFVGLVPVAFLGDAEAPARNEQLLYAAPLAASLNVSIEGDVDDERFGVANFDLRDTARRDALFATAYQEAQAAARTPKTCEKAPN